MTGAQVARQLLDSQGLQNVKIEQTPGLLSDHYDPRSKILRLSQSVHNSANVAAAGIAAHEAGHALQHAANYYPMYMRSLIVPVVQLSSKIAPWIFFIGLSIGSELVSWIGIILFGAQTFFSLVTLPVEYNASSRAKQLLVAQGIIQRDENIEGLNAVLGAAAWTYVAGAVSALGSLLYLVAILVGRRRLR